MQAVTRRREVTSGIAFQASRAPARERPRRSISAAMASPSATSAAFSEGRRQKGGHVYEEDGRNFLLRSTARYQVISMEISSVWFAGAADLNSREFYR